MDTLSLNYEITDKDRDEEGKLKESFIFNAEANFSKKIMDLVKSGNVITIKSFKTKEGIMQVIEDVEVIDPNTKEKKILKDPITKPCYNCIAIINLNKIINFKGKKSNREARHSTVTIKNGKAVVQSLSKRPEIQNIGKKGSD